MLQNLLKWERLWRETGELRRAMPPVWNILADSAIREDLVQWVEKALEGKRGQATVVMVLDDFIDYFEKHYHDQFHNPSKRGPKWEAEKPVVEKSAAVLELEKGTGACTSPSSIAS